ncbi:1,4-alpha-glucan branching protein GlgB [Bacilliculturomica massiliensis]|uniref:1,4-alpha-glucan branching protein GlgB n=1 Tax=Bacilliculturomica massiliensis TaxID=1917867 RepID=UPI00102F5C21|nr:1,4-alpha-glucan branching protein GlgB [Bacilliculturomica massiliensis]
MKKNLELPVYLFHQGTAERAYELLGSHPCVSRSEEGYIFRVWAPNAEAVFLQGDFNGWTDSHPMKKLNEQGIWEVFVPGIGTYEAYKYAVDGRDGKRRMKADPYGFHMETRPGTASKTYDISQYKWKDKQWKERGLSGVPVNIYEVHPGSWKRYPDGNFYSYEKLAEELIPYVKEMGYTHIELMPVAEYPFDASWGYQIIGYYAPTSRYGTPEGFMSFVDACHQNGIGVILDWVPGHFPKDAAGLFCFDGGSCYEYEDELKREHREWGTMVFDWGRGEVRSFLISNALYWIEQYHIDGLRVDAVASMLYLDYNRQGGEWRPNRYGGKENLEAIDFLHQLNQTVARNHPNVMMIAEESTAWPMVTRPVEEGGLGFNFKWNMGWMNDTLEYMKTDPLFRQGRHNAMTFAMTYAFSERFILPLSHDEVVHMKGSLINKMPGEYEDKFSNLKTYYGYMMTHPGKKLLFMGGELAQFNEWHFEDQLDWNLLEFDMHRKFRDYVKDLNLFYRENRQLWELDDSWEGFLWNDADDASRNIYCYRRIGLKGDPLIVILNFAAAKHTRYRVGVPAAGTYEAVFHSNDIKYGGTGRHMGAKKADKTAHQGCTHSLSVELPPLSMIILKRKAAVRKTAKAKTVK